MTDAKPTQVLQITPSRELVFHGPFTDVVQAQMVLKNPTSRHVVFKVKTTAPKQYCVRPNSGMVEPNDQRIVTVMLQPLDGLPADATRHKFMVQSCYAAPDADIDNIWKSTDPSQLMYSKLMVQFEPGRSATGTGAGDVRSTSLGQGKEEAPARLSNTHENQSSYQSIHGGEGRKSSGSGSSLNDSFSRGHTSSGNQALVERLESEKAALKRDNDELFKRYTKLQQELQSRGGDQFGETGLPTLQVILISLAALLLGLIVGKLF